MRAALQASASYDRGQMVGNQGYVRHLCIAALACLQPGIEPVFLNLLTAHAGLPPVQHGWVAGGGQLGMALGALLCWSVPSTTTRVVALVATLTASAVGLLMVGAVEIEWIILIRAIMGFCSGLVFTRATGAATRANPNHAFGMILLIQLLLATAVSIILPLAATATTPAFAIGLTSLCPIAMFVLLAGEGTPVDDRSAARPLIPSTVGRRPPLVSVALVLAMFLVVATTMMIWSYAGALGTFMGLGDQSVGLGVAVGSFSGVLPALAASRTSPRAPPALTGLICGLAMLTLLAIPALRMGEAGFITAMCLFNVGSTFAIIRFSALAVGQNAPAALRRCVAALHCAAMVAGPFAAGGAVNLAGFDGLDMLAVFALAIAVVALFLATPYGRPSGAARSRLTSGYAAEMTGRKRPFASAEIALD
jgi:hypothetical protein